MKKEFAILALGIILAGSTMVFAADTAPVISSSRAENIVGPGAQIKWTTDAASSSKVWYSTTSGSYPLSSEARCDSGGEVTAHCVNLTSLSYSTVYYYRIESRTATGVTATSAEYQFTSGTSSASSDSNYTGGSTTTITVPAVPSGLTAQVATNGIDVNLSWTDNSTNESEFKIYHRPQSGSWSYLTFVSSGSTSFTYYQHPAGTYEYHINACNSAGCSADSNIASVTKGSSGSTDPVTTTVPAAPASLTATLASNGRDVTLSWTDNSTNESEFKIYWRPSGGTWSYFASMNTGVTTFLYTYHPSGIYEYRVNACNSAGCSADSNVATITVSSSANPGGGTATTTIPNAPSGLSAVLAANASDVNLSWTDNSTNESEFKIYFRAQGGTWSYLTLVSSGVTAFTYYNHPSGTYEYHINACNSAGCSADSNVATVTKTGNTSGGTATTTLAVNRFSGYVKDSTFRGVSFVSVRYNFSATNPAPSNCTANPSFAASTDANGFWSLLNPAPGSYCFYAEAINAQTQIVYPPAYNSGSFSVPDLIFAAHTASSTPSSTLPTMPSAPSGLTAELAPNGADVNFSWVDNSSSETEFKISSRPQGGSWSSLTSVSAGQTTFTYYNHPAGTYEYHVNACNSGGCSADSNIATVTRGTSIKPSDFFLDFAATTPKTGDSAVAVDATLKIRFTKNLDPLSTISRFFSLTSGSAGGAEVAGSFQIYPNGFDFKPTTHLAAGTNYTYRVYASLRDTAGNNLASEAVMSFTTTGAGTGAVARLEGLVFDAQGRVVTSASYFIAKEDFSSTFWGSTDSNGAFSVSVPAGTYGAEIFPPPGRSDLARALPLKFSVSAGESKQITFNLTGATKLVLGKVTFTDGRAVTDAEIGAYSSATGQWTGAFVDKNGNYSLRLSGGKWQIGVRPQNPQTARWSFSGKFTEVEFAGGGLTESKTIDFVVAAADAILEVTVTDSAGKALSNVAVMVDTMSASAHKAGSMSMDRLPPEFRKTGSTGKVTFTLRPGNYYVRSFLPPDSGYLNPAEQVVDLVSGKTNKLAITFAKKNITTTALLKGVTKLSDGTATEAFIWGWSEDGGFISGRSNPRGVFEFQVAPGAAWHIGAGKEINSVPFKAPEVTIAISKEGTSVELILEKFRDIPLPPPVSVKQAASQQVVAQAKDGAEITLPPNAVTSTATVNVEIKPTIEAPSQAGSQVVSTVYDVTVKDVSGKEIKQFAADAEIILPYDPQDLAAKGVTTENLVPSYYDETSGTWIKVDHYTLDPAKNQIVVRVKHFTKFALVAAADVTAPEQPTKAVATATGGGIKLAWVNPAKDFHHAKIYRSETSGSLGKVLASSVLASEYLDTEVNRGKIYYYVVRAVDPAGNETNNASQISAMAQSDSVSVTPAPTPAVPATPAPLPAAAPSQEVFGRDLRMGSRGDDVRRLQEILTAEGFYRSRITGYYGAVTRRGVAQFQKKYASDILAPTGRKRASGIVDNLTRAKLNALAGSSSAQVQGQFLRTLARGSRGEDVSRLQQRLGEAGVYQIKLVTGYFGPLTRAAVIRYQEKYAAAILGPLGLRQGTGFVGPMTLAHLSGSKD